MVKMNDRGRGQEVHTVIPIDQVVPEVIPFFEKIAKFLISTLLHIEIRFYFKLKDLYLTMTERISSFRLFLKN